MDSVPASPSSPFSQESPVDFSPLEPVVETPVGAVEEIVTRARRTQPAWSQLQVVERMELLIRLKDRILDAGDEIARTLHNECGKPEAEAWTAEVLPNADLIAHWIDHIEAALAPEEVHLDALIYPGKSGMIEPVARGVVALITPWNFPFAIPLRTIVPALLAGNVVVFKPSEHAPRSGALIARLCEGIVPTGVLSLLQGGGAVARALIDATPDLIVFTGSVATGRKVAVAAAERLIPVSLELGGKDAAIVLEDADLDRTARGLVWGACNNAGQSCASIERVSVDRKVARPLVDRMVSLTKRLRLGEDVGALTTRAQLETVKRHVADAVAHGAKVLCGGNVGAVGLTFEPTILEIGATGATGARGEELAVMREETFGPVLPVVIVDSEHDAVDRANASRFGLTGSVWSKKISHGQAIAARLRVGVVTINNHGFTAVLPAAPWGGVGDSGYGITNSKHAIGELTRPRFTLTDRSNAKSELWWMPYSPSLIATARALAVLRSSAKTVIEKAKALWVLVTNAPKRLMGR
ncbi:MAG: aldehyde dehydrogenase family protein [Polyangiales bacterium]